MGFSSIWTALIGSRVKEITPHRPFSFEQQEAAAVEEHASAFYTHHAAAFSEAVLNPPVGTQDDKKAKRRSRGFSLSKTKSEGDLKRRKSWFGGKPAAEDAPPMPALPVLRSTGSGLGWYEQGAAAEPQPTRPGTALTTDDPITWSRPVTPEAPQVEKRKSRRLSLGRALMSSRKRSKTTTSQAPPTPKLEKRQSVLGGHRDMAVPSVPTYATELINPDHGDEPLLESSFQQRKSQRISSNRGFNGERRKSAASARSQRGSWWQSSNPEDGDAPPPVPHVPSLSWDDGSATPESSIAFTASPDNSDFIDQSVFADSPVRTVTRGTSIKHPRPVSGVSLSSRRSYKPQHAASGFLKSTSDRSSRRHSLLDDGDGGMICLSDEQQREWDKLKNLMITLEGRQDSSPVYKSSEVVSLAEDNGVMGMLRAYEQEEDKKHRRMFSNSEALAALEFGTAR
ncbi:hypothetical protein LTR56_013363 [Elasticomyces elasticus]|nr:hypothetical protein LTR56_013363 [Elasticomyces elasticus]KAK3665676.1 hypothetical protein LTR22_003307 [Elasticomyces elasticus]KAK4909983.1 hypothetical protein LTR49_021257 [Elasticomyces elasticus]KAK5751474.1 hypothetical protein LTS12_018485 [Elasticomyces elasticus]